MLTYFWPTKWSDIYNLWSTKTLLCWSLLILLVGLDTSNMAHFLRDITRKLKTKKCKNEFRTVESAISDTGISNNLPYPTWSIGPFNIWFYFLSPPCILIRLIRHRHIQHNFVGPFKCLSSIIQPSYLTIEFRSGFQMNLVRFSGLQLTLNVYKEKKSIKNVLNIRLILPHFRNKSKQCIYGLILPWNMSDMAKFSQENVGWSRLRHIRQYVGLRLIRYSPYPTYFPLSL